MNVAITGALGHIGSSLIHNLNHKLILIDNLSTQRYCSLFDIPSSIKYNFIQADILSVDLIKLFEGSDVVIHLAAITDAETSFNKEELVNQVNIQGTKLVAEACSKVGCRLIYTSTTSVYGVSDIEVNETCINLKPQSPYAKSKLKSELILQSIPNLHYVILRMGTIFGISPGMRFHTAINKFCFQTSFGQPISVWKTALNKKRPYLDLKDMVRAIKLIIKHSLYNKEIYNLVTINTTVQDILNIIGSKNINYVDSPIMNQFSYTVSSKKFENLGFEFKGNLKQGIKETIELL